MKNRISNGLGWSFLPQAAVWAVSFCLLGHSNAEITVTIDAPPAAAGETTMASITVHQAVGLAGADIVIAIPDFVTAGAAETTAVMGDILVASSSQPGRIEIALAGRQGLSSDQATILTIPMRIGKAAPEGGFTLSFTELQLYDAQPTVVAAKALDGSIRVLAPPADRDGDGLPDVWEQQFFGDSSGIPESDSDGDGNSDYQEFMAGTDPASAQSVFRITKVQELDRVGQRTTLIQWEDRGGRNFQIHWSNGIGPQTAWHRVYNPAIRKEGNLLSWTDDGTRTHAGLETSRERYYRISVVPHAP